MKLSFATLGCPEWTLEQIAENAAGMGFDGVELRGVAGEHIGPDETPEERARIRDLFAAKGVEIACIMGYSKFTWEDRAQLAGDVEVARKFVGVAADLGCPVLRIFGGMWGEADREAALARVVGGLKQVAPVAEEAGVKLAIETHDDWCKGENLAAVMDGVGSPALGVCWDIANAFTVEPLEETYASIAGRIYHVHFKDVGLEGDKHVAKLLGEGDVDLAGGLQILKRDGYDAYLSFEWEKKWQPELQEPEVAFPHYASEASRLMAEAGLARSASGGGAA